MQYLKSYRPDGYPERCPVCGNPELTWRVINTINYTVSEEEITCPVCDSFVSEWAYGYFFPHPPELEMKSRTYAKRVNVMSKYNRACSRLKPCNDFYIKSAFQKIDSASIKEKGCRLTFEECRAISIHHAIPDAIGDYDHWKFDSHGYLITR